MNISLTPFVDLLIFQSTPFCNVNCSYCYLPHRTLKKRMSLSVVKATIQRLEEAGLLGSSVRICWHAGEPLTLPPKYYEEAIEVIKAHLPSKTRPIFMIQTNGTLIDQHWCNLFRKYDFEVGVSIDGPRAIHDAARTYRSGRGTFDHVLRGIRHLQDAGISYNVICVLTLDALDKAQELYDFFTEEDIDDVCFNIEETEGINESALIRYAGVEDRFREFYRNYLTLASNASKRHWVREIDETYKSLFLSGDAETLNQQITPLAICSIDVDGNISTFSPELMGISAPEFNNFEFGNVLLNTIEEVLQSDAFKLTFNKIDQGVKACESICEYFSICKGGAPSNKFFEHGSLSATETVYCKLKIKSTADELIVKVCQSTDQLL